MRELGGDVEAGNRAEGEDGRAEGGEEGRVDE